MQKKKKKKEKEERKKGEEGDLCVYQDPSASAS